MTEKPRFTTAQVIAVAAVIVLVALLRIERAVHHPDWPNFSPVMAMAFCGGLFLPGLMAWILPFAILIASDIGLSLAMGYPAFGLGQTAAWACFAAAIGLGRFLARKNAFGFWPLLGAVVGNAVLFYLVTNSLCWLFEPAYARGVAGWVQALTVGLPIPGAPPTWVFFRNSLASDFLFVGLILGVRALALRASSEPVPARA